MMQSNDIRRDLDPSLAPEEAEALARLAERLRQGRPVPAAVYRGELRRRLVAEAAGRERWEPRRLRMAVAAYVASGTVLLLVAAVSVLGVGPLAAPG